jgi:hypothetical protein
VNQLKGGRLDPTDKVVFFDLCFSGDFVSEKVDCMQGGVQPKVWTLPKVELGQTQVALQPMAAYRSKLKTFMPVHGCLFLSCPLNVKPDW